MSDPAVKKVNNVCPRSCYSSCTMITHVENGRLTQLSGDRSHPYTNGKLCPRGFAYIEGNEHHDRLKYPYYQEIKGSGKFTQITWETAFELIINELTTLYLRNKDFLPLALFKGTGNLGVHHFVTDEFFSSLGETTRLYSGSTITNGLPIEGIPVPDPTTIRHASMIIIWGANPAVTNLHLIPFIIEAKTRGAKLVVIDPLYTQTAELADLYLQLRPSTDGALAALLMKGLVKDDSSDSSSSELAALLDGLPSIDTQECLSLCGITAQARDVLLIWLKKAESVAHVFGAGLQRYNSNTDQTIRAIIALAALHGDFDKKGGGVYSRHTKAMTFKNQQLFHNELHKIKNRVLTTNPLAALSDQQAVDMLWISGANPLDQPPQSYAVKRFMQTVPFVVTVDQFLTSTAKMSNLILPTTSHFEEVDLLASVWHKEIAINEPAISPFFQSRSEWAIINELAARLKKIDPHLCSFPLYTCEEDYLNAQFNEKVFENYRVKNLVDVKYRKMNDPFSKGFKGVQLFSEPHIDAKESKKILQKALSSFELVEKGGSPPKEYPFWLITPHHPYKLNSQFQFLRLTDETEAFVGINPTVAKSLNIRNGEVIRLYNHQLSFEIMVNYGNNLPHDVLYIYKGWSPEIEGAQPTVISQEEVESSLTNQFVNISKLTREPQLKLNHRSLLHISKHSHQNRKNILNKK